MKRQLSTLGVALGLLFSTGCFLPPVDAGSDKDPSADSARCSTPENAERLADQVLNLVNLERAAVGLPPVTANLALDSMAADYACRMIEMGFFDHEDPENGFGPAERARSVQYASYAVGENLAAGAEEAGEVMRIWMESPSHRANILDPGWEEVGIAVRLGGEYAVYWVQEFGRPVEEE